MSLNITVDMEMEIMEKLIERNFYIKRTQILNGKF